MKHKPVSKGWIARAIHYNQSNEYILGYLEDHYGLKPKEARRELRRAGRNVKAERRGRRRPSNPFIRILKEVALCTFLVLLVAAVAYVMI